MAKQNASLLAFNRGIISPLALARTDVERISLSAEIQTNWMPRILGSMMLRTGLEFTGGIKDNNFAVHIPFVFAKDDLAIIEITEGSIRVKVDDEAISRVSVSTSITNGTFDSNISGWTDNDESGATSAFVSGGYMGLTGNGTNFARRTQQITVSASDINKEHALNIVIERGPVVLKVGSTSGDDDYIAETKLGEGVHSLSLTPDGNFFIDFSSNLQRIVLVDSVSIASSGDMVLDSPYLEDDLSKIRWDQSADVIFISCAGYQQRKIERRSTTGWSIVKYLTEDGPVRDANNTNITITPSAVNGNITLTASKSLFKSNQVGGLFKIVSTGQFVTKEITSENDFSETIEVEGSGNRRIFTITRSGTFTATITLQRSFDEGATFEDVETYTTAGSKSLDDGLDNTNVLYRIGVKTGNYTSGTITVSLSYNLGSKTGYVRLTAFSSATSVSAEVLKTLGNTTATSNWSEGEWSDYRGYPSGVALFEGRLWWGGKSKLFGSIADAFESFDEDVEGDAGLIRTILGSGAIDEINWLLPLYRLMLGTASEEKAVKTTSFEEAITPDNFKIVSPSNQGSSNINPAKLDKKGIFVQSSGTRLFELDFDQQSLDYGSTELTKLSPEIGEPSITRIAIARQPDTRVHCVRSDGKVAVLCYDPLENLKAFILIETDGVVEDVFVLPGDEESRVYYGVKRTINGSTVRYLEKFALESECQGGTINKQADSFVVYQGSATTTITGLSHLEGESVVVWADGIDVGTKTVSGGSITLSSAASNVVVGLTYTAQYKSVKLTYGAQSGTALNQVKRVNNLAFILRNTHFQGLKYGADFDNLWNLPKVEDGKATSNNQIFEDYDKPFFAFEGIWDTDSRICLQAQAPRPATVVCATFNIQTNEEV